MAKKLILPVLKINQPHEPQKGIYIGKIKVKDLINETQFKIDYWDPKKKTTLAQGYQREPSKIRYIKIAKYIENTNEPIFPTTILINSRDSLKFESDDKKNGWGKLIINKYPLWIVDGQHRIGGLKYAITELGLKNWEEMELPVVSPIFFNSISLLIR